MRWVEGAERGTRARRRPRLSSPCGCTWPTATAGPSGSLLGRSTGSIAPCAHAAGSTPTTSTRMVASTRAVDLQPGGAGRRGSAAARSDRRRGRARACRCRAIVAPPVRRDRTWQHPPVFNAVWFRNMLALDARPVGRARAGARQLPQARLARRPRRRRPVHGGRHRQYDGTPAIDAGGFVQLYALRSWPRDRLPLVCYLPARNPSRNRPDRGPRVPRRRASIATSRRGRRLHDGNRRRRRRARPRPCRPWLRGGTARAGAGQGCRLGGPPVSGDDGRALGRTERVAVPHEPRTGWHQVGIIGLELVKPDLGISRTSDPSAVGLREGLGAEADPSTGTSVATASRNSSRSPSIHGRTSSP